MRLLNLLMVACFACGTGIGAEPSEETERGFFVSIESDYYRLYVAGISADRSSVVLTDGSCWYSESRSISSRWEVGDEMRIVQLSDGCIAFFCEDAFFGSVMRLLEYPDIETTDQYIVSIAGNKMELADGSRWVMRDGLKYAHWSNWQVGDRIFVTISRGKLFDCYHVWNVDAQSPFYQADLVWEPDWNPGYSASGGNRFRSSCSSFMTFVGKAI